MKKITTLLSLLSIGFSVLMAQKPVTIEGSFAREKFAEVKLFKVVDGTSKPIATAQPNSKGKFGFQFFPEYEGLYMVGTGTNANPQGNYKFWLKSGDRLGIAINDTAYSLTGVSNSKENQVLTQWYKMAWLVEWKSVYFSRNQSTYVDFFPELDKLLPKAKAWLAAPKATGNKKFEAALKDIVNLDLAFFAVNFLNTPRSAHPDKEELPDYYSSVSVNSVFPTAQKAYDYPWGMRAFSTILMRDRIKSGEKPKTGLEGTKEVFALINNDTLKGDFALDQAAVIKDYGKYLEFKNGIEEYILTENQKQREFQINSALATLKPGDKGYEFKFEDKNGKTVAFSDLKGKVVLIDTWATWCGPCKVEIPHLKKLEEAMQGKDVAIVSISVDEEKDKDKWKQMIADQSLGGLQLFASGWSDITKYYKITGIPRFMVFDKDGKIVTVDAPRPSSPDLKPLLEKYL
jgi:thiol-disulfide isomerase/thioredoxin